MRPCPGKWNDIKPSPEMWRFVSVKSEGKISEEKLLICCLLWRNALQTVRRKNAEGEIWMFVIFCVDFETQRCEKQYFFLKLFQTWNDEWHPELKDSTPHICCSFLKKLYFFLSPSSNASSFKFCFSFFLNLFLFCCRVKYFILSHLSVLSSFSTLLCLQTLPWLEREKLLLLLKNSGRAHKTKTALIGF